MKYTADEMNHPIGRLSGGAEGEAAASEDQPGREATCWCWTSRRGIFSPLSGPVIRGLLRRYSDTIISVSHDRKYIEEVCGRICRLTPDGLERAAGLCRRKQVFLTYEGNGLIQCNNTDMPQKGAAVNVLYLLSELLIPCLIFYIVAYG